MFDISSSKLLILGLVALMVIGPKELPALLRALGKYMAIIRRHANEFRAQFDEAMRESELDELKKQMQSVGEQAEATMRQAETAIEKQLDETRIDLDAQKMIGDPFTGSQPAATTPVEPAPIEPPPVEPVETVPPSAADAPRAPEKTGA